MGRLYAGMLVFALICSIVPAGCADRGDRFPTLRGEYLGQTPPRDSPKLFAPGIVNTGLFTRDVAMTPDGTEIYFTVVIGNYAYSSIIGTRLIGGKWTRPEVAPFSGNPEWRDAEPFITPDGGRFYFISNRPAPGADKDEENWDIWVMDSAGDGWGEPWNLGPPINTEMGEYFPSLTLDGTLYFTRGNEAERTNYILRSRPAGDTLAEPEMLGPGVNSTKTQFNAYIAPDESYLIFSAFGRDDGLGGADYYIVYRDGSDAWTGPVNLGDEINRPTGMDWSPYVSPDGKYFFFMSTRIREEWDPLPGKLTYRKLEEMYEGPEGGNPGIYWVSASFIDDLRPEGKESK